MVVPVFRDVAQPGSALAWGARGRWFESSRPDKKGNTLLVLVEVTRNARRYYIYGHFYVPSIPWLVYITLSILRKAVFKYNYAFLPDSFKKTDVKFYLCEKWHIIAVKIANGYFQKPLINQT